MRWPLTALLLLFAAMPRAESPVLAPGYSELQFTPPAAGSYQLPPLGPAGDGKVLDETGKAMPLGSLLGDKFALLGFIYTRCPDVNGCPLASYVMRQVQHALQQDAALGSRVRLISLSFDPANDSPQAMSDYSRHFRRHKFDWQFLTTASEGDLQPLLTSFNQYRRPVYSADGEYTGTMSHILRVFLIDKQRQIRNIYSADFLHVDTVLNDIRTLALENQS
ncbi:SCO family protein [Seongchinamella unica]|uniref:SCO family protein n=1 Tax=Seongchinamella unica TaxID=2547392 RepID=A0A4R5LNJ1_9GAMM|nr:SCO family protein [Seongchinamella unica]TDG11885.1 SCO family protein [Seongchinamella unica]